MDTGCRLFLVVGLLFYSTWSGGPLFYKLDTQHYKIMCDVVYIFYTGEGFEAVTFPSILLGNPPMKTSMSFSDLCIMFGHKSANSWNLLMSLFNLVQAILLACSILIGFSLDPRFLLGFSVFAMVAASASRAAAIPS
uniref:Uncharacterized protein n=1 Tax=Tanacetum cinerariifolium TaxID=118510 RepID=A0A6L2NRG1_TANCI|nr:hypothetical protein [Tanacetum cinerariifolium]